jgi:hypothetical protein
MGYTTVTLISDDDQIEAKLPTHMCGTHTKLAEGVEIDISGLDEQERALLNGVADGNPLGELGIEIVCDQP